MFDENVYISQRKRCSLSKMFVFLKETVESLRIICILHAKWIDVWRKRKIG